MPSDPRPGAFCAFTTPEFWDDDHISARMLVHHLDPDTPFASRPHGFIDASVEWLVEQLGLRPGAHVLDLGCGPGLYAVRLAARGIAVTGVDVSRRSIAHAAAVARREHLPITLVRGSYLDPAVELGAGFDAAILIYEDYCTLSPPQRAALLRRVHASLRPGGGFVLDVTSAARFVSLVDARTEAENLMDGFWASEPYTGVHETFTYPEQRLVLDRYTIRTAEGTRLFWNWMHCLTPAEAREELTAAGFTDLELFGDVAGAEYDAAGWTFAVRAVSAGR